MNDLSQLTHLADRVAREDLLMFINACFACSGQREFYSDGHGQSVAIEFLHRYVLGNYRTLYARTLAAGVNDFNQALIVLNLLSSGAAFAGASPAERDEENALLTRAFETLPPHRAFHLAERLRERRVNNRRTRAVLRRFLQRPEALELRAVKYRRSFSRAARHVHLKLEGELAPFFLRGWRERHFRTPLFESFRQAHYAENAIYELPFSIAEGLAQKHGVPREVFLRRIEPRLTRHERLRLQDASAAALGKAYEVDWSKLPLTKLASYVLTRRDRRAHQGELHAALAACAERAVLRTHARFGRVACVLDRSFSSSGSSEKRQRPLAVALATTYFLRAASAEYHAFWTGPPPERELLVDARGQTDLSTPFIDALAVEPELIVIVSDGFDNDPPGVAAQVIEIALSKLSCPPVVHLSPVFDAESYAPKSLTPKVPTMGIREAENIPTLLAFARAANERAPLALLLDHLSSRVARFVNRSIPGAP